MGNWAGRQIYTISHSLRITLELVWFWDEVSWRRRSIILLDDSCLGNGWVIIVATLRWIHPSVFCPYARVNQGRPTRASLHTILLYLAQCHELTLINLDQVICSSLLNIRCYHSCFLLGIITCILIVIDRQGWVFAWLVEATSFKASPRQLFNQLIVLMTQTICQLALMITTILVGFTTLTGLFRPSRYRFFTCSSLHHRTFLLLVWVDCFWTCASIVPR